MQVQTKNFISFKAISLSKDEKKRSDKLLNSIDNPAIKEQAKIDLFEIFDRHLQKEAETKAGKLYRYEDFLQKLYLIFLESLENIKSLSTDKLIEILNSTKPNEEEIKEEYRIKTYSINKKRSHDDNRTIETKLSEDKILKPISAVSTEERAEQLKEIQELAETLSLGEQDLIRKRAEGKFYKTIAQEVGLSATRTQYKTKSAIAKVQQKNNKLPKEYEIFANKLIKTFDLSISGKKVINSIINNIDIVNYDIETLFDKINTISKELEINKKSLIAAMLKAPALFSLKAETVIGKIDITSKMLEVDRKVFAQAALKQPSLFYIKSETILGNVESNSQLLEVDREVFIQAALKCPALFVQNPKTLFNNIDTAAKIFEVDRQSFINAALKLPTLFCRNPITLFNNIDKASKLIDVDRKVLVDLALKHPSLFYQKPEKIAKKVNIIKYYKEIQGKKIKRIAYSSNSDEKLYHNILAYLVKSHDGLEHLLKDNEVIAYLKSQNKMYNFTIPVNKLAEEFIKYAQKFSKSNFGKQIFNIVVK